MTHAVLEAVLNIVRPAQQVVASLPIKRITPTPASLAELEQKFSAPSKRTYYLGTNGRVSQRKALVGEVLATVRACNTDQARFLFSDYNVMRTYPVSVPKPYIGELEA